MYDKKGRMTKWKLSQLKILFLNRIKNGIGRLWKQGMG